MIRFENLGYKYTADEIIEYYSYFSYLHDLGVRVQVNSDSHYPERISNGRPEALCALRKAGDESVMELHGGEWKEMPIVF